MPREGLPSPAHPLHLLSGLQGRPFDNSQLQAPKAGHTDS